MKVLVIGKGAREHAILKYLKKSPKIEKLFCLPGNGGTEKEAVNVPISELDNEKILEFAKKENINFVVVTPDNPLANGLVDCLEKENIPCFGPTKKAAQIEASKVFAKNLMKKYNIPTAKYESFKEPEKALTFLKENEKYPIVLKADGLAFGKGVIIANSFKEAEKAVQNLMINNKFNNGSNKIVIEEFLEGVEVSMLTITDGKTIKPLISSQDHKRAYENDEGPNTGGMGVIAPNPYYTKEIAKICEEKIFIPTIKAMQKEGCPFKGCLYFGLMLTKDGPKVIEYNCRFGDPETQAILPLLKTDLFSILKASQEEKLEEISIEFSNNCCCCVVLASKGYPEQFETGFEINFNNLEENTIIFHAGTSLKNNKLTTSGGRVICVCKIAENFKSSIAKTYEEVEKIDFKNKYYRKDIGKKALILENSNINV